MSAVVTATSHLSGAGSFASTSNGPGSYTPGQAGAAAAAASSSWALGNTSAEISNVFIGFGPAAGGSSSVASTPRGDARLSSAANAHATATATATASASADTKARHPFRPRPVKVSSSLLHIKVLAAEDDPLVRRVLRMTLKLAGMECEPMADGMAVTDALGQDPASADLVLVRVGRTDWGG